jgi:HD-GYP domain-containing protein (c-di-GMP phosphodiesterase class II)
VLAHPRPHKKAWPLERATQEIFDQAGRQFDPEVVSAFRRLDAAGLLEPVDDQLRRAA